jgi:hypothetical protein
VGKILAKRKVKDEMRARNYPDWKVTALQCDGDYAGAVTSKLRLRRTAPGKIEELYDDLEETSTACGSGVEPDWWGTGCVVAMGEEGDERLA